MTLPDPPAPRKPRRLGLFAPFVLLLIAAAIYSGVWFWLRMQAEQRLDELAGSLRQRGYTVAWERRQVGGYPFRMDVDFANLSIREPSGWAISFPQLRTEAYVYALHHWIGDAPQGLTFTRPLGGPVRVQARALRASLTGFDEHPPRLSVEGMGLTFAPAPGARPFFLAAANDFQFHLRQGPDDQGGAFLSVTGARARADGLIGRIAAQGPVNLRADVIYSRAHLMAGDNWPDAVRTWTAGGGMATLRDGSLAAGQAQLRLGNSQPLSVGADGRLAGSLTASLQQAPQVIAAAGQSGTLPPQTAAAASTAVTAAQGSQQAAEVTVDFRDGRAFLGPLDLGPAPRVY